jgi:hypothetical protein
MLGRYERLRMRMTRSEVRSAVGQLPAGEEVWGERTTYMEQWETVAKDVDANALPLPPSGEGITWDGWVDRDVIMYVNYRDGKAFSKTLVKTTRDWRRIANAWFARVRQLFSQD